MHSTDYSDERTAVDSISRVSGVTRAVEAANSISAFCIHITVVSSKDTLIDICKHGKMVFSHTKLHTRVLSNLPLHLSITLVNNTNVLCCEPLLSQLLLLHIFQHLLHDTASWL